MGTASEYIKAVQRTSTSRISDFSTRAVGELLQQSWSFKKSPISSDGLLFRRRVRSFSSDGLFILLFAVPESRFSGSDINSFS